MPAAHHDVTEFAALEATVNSTTPHRVAGTVLSEHRTSMGLVRYRRWSGSIIVELLRPDEPAAILAMVGSLPPPEGRTVRGR